MNNETTKIDIYLASPLTDPSPVLMLGRYRAAVQAASQLKATGYSVFCPVAHGYAFTVANENVKHTWHEWEVEDTAVLAICRCFAVLQLPGWDTSVGLKAELVLAQKMGLPIVFMDHPLTERGIVAGVIKAWVKPFPRGQNGASNWTPTAAVKQRLSRLLDPSQFDLERKLACLLD